MKIISNSDLNEEKIGLISSLKAIKPMLLSHHPNCEKFNEHTFNIGKYKFCIGCFIGYPVAIISVLTISIFLHLFTSQLLFIVGTILMLSFLLSPLNLTKKKMTKIIQKILFNVGAAFLFWWILSLPNSIMFNVYLLYLLFGIFFIMVNAYHMYGNYRICKKCEHSLDWEICPGFKDIRDYCKDNDLPNPFKTQRK